MPLVQKKRGFGYFLVINNFGNFGWTVSLEKNSQSIGEAFENILKSSNRKPKLKATDDASDFVNEMFTNLLKHKNVKRYSRKTSLGAVFAARLNRTNRHLFKNLFLIKVMQIGLKDYQQKKYKKRIHLSTNLTPNQACLKKYQKTGSDNLQVRGN